MSTEFSAYKTLIDSELEALFCGVNTDAKLLEAMKYAVMSGGKRVRPTLCFLSAEFCGGKCEAVIPYALAIELIHNYSLVHDDLPSMDNDDYRRGRPTLHKKFDEGTAVLTGDALMNLAFEVLFDGLRKHRINSFEAAYVVSQASGHSGMILGQVLDLKAVSGEKVDIFEINRNKTGALITASVLTGALEIGCDAERLLALCAYADKLGEAFQIADDILDYNDGERTAGNYANYYGLSAARAHLSNLTAAAEDAVEKYSNSERLIDYARLLCGRDF